MWVSRLLNTAWMLSCNRDRKAFLRASTCVRSTQESLLFEILRKNYDCRFGRRYGFDSIRDVDDFRDRVPITDSAAYQADVADICAGQSGVLTSEPVRLLEPTSGTNSGRRLIPYTTTLQQQYQRAINAWIADLYRRRPAVRRGRAYWSVSPAIQPETTPGGLRIGFADDTEYLGPIARRLSKKLLAISADEMRGIQQDVFFETLCRLIHVRDLSLISVWSPTFLSSIVHGLENDADRLQRAINNSPRSGELLDIVSSSQPLAEKIQAIWPRLALISCWADSSAANYVPELQTLFPRVEIQPKGLVSTEAFVSFPMVDYDGSALSIRSHFFEFRPHDQSNRNTRLAHELAEGQSYEVVVTTGGGLYRYRTRDVITVVGFLNETPLIRFCGRADGTSDMVGEKLTHIFVEDAIDDALTQFDLGNTPALLVPDTNQIGYRLFVSPANSSVSPTAIGNAVEAKLIANPYYEHAIRLGQLKPLVVSIVDQPRQLLLAYEDHLASCGIRTGDIKPTVLVFPQHADGVLRRLLQSGGH